MDVTQLLERLDACYRQSDLGQAEALVMRGITECESRSDTRGLLTLYNELGGLYRVTGRAGEAAENTNKLLELIEELGIAGTVQHGATLLNGATINRVAGNQGKALRMYQEAEKIFFRQGQTQSFYMASLYNNRSQLYQDRKQYEAALEDQRRARKLLENLKDSESELATTKINMSYTLMALNRPEEAEKLLKEALEYYESGEGTADSHYGAALSALGELTYKKKKYKEALEWFEKSLERERNHFGENDACKIIRKNIAAVRVKMKGAE